MPKLPTYDSNRQLTTQQPKFLAAENVDSKIQGLVVKGLEQTGEAAIKWNNAIDTIQTTTSQANRKLAYAQLETQADSDVDYNNSKFYMDEIDKATKKSVEGFSNAGTVSRVALDANYEAEMAKIKIGSIFKKKTIEAGQVAALNLMDQEVKNPTTQSATNINAVLDYQVKAGIFGQKEAYEIGKKAIKDAKHQAFVYDLGADPATAEKNLNANAYDFDTEQLSKAKDQYDREIKIIQTANEESIEKKYINGERASVEEITNLMNTGKIDAKFAKSMIKEINNPYDNVKTNPVEYERLMTLMLDKKMKASTLREELVTARANRLLSEGDYKDLLYTKQEGRDVSVLFGYNQETHQTNSFWGAALNAVRNTAVNVFNGGVAMASDMTRTLINKAKSKNATPEQMPAIAKEVVKEQVLKIRPDATTYDEKEGQLMVDSAGNKAIVYPDGRIVEKN